MLTQTLHLMSLINFCAEVAYLFCELLSPGCCCAKPAYVCSLNCCHQDAVVLNRHMSVLWTFVIRMLLCWTVMCLFCELPSRECCCAEPASYVCSVNFCHQDAVVLNRRHMSVLWTSVTRMLLCWTGICLFCELLSPGCCCAEPSYVCSVNFCHQDVVVLNRHMSVLWTNVTRML